MTTTLKVYNGDVLLNQSNGQYEFMSDKVKLSQDVRCLLLIEPQTDNGFGAGLDSMIGELPSDELGPDNINFELGFRLRSAFKQMKSLQRLVQFGQRPLNELVDRIILVRASPDRIDRTMYRFIVSISNLANQVVRLGGKINI